MRIEFWGALRRAWQRMTDLLFRPLDPLRWLVLAFCAWVAGLLDGHGGSPGGIGSRGDRDGGFGSADFDPQAVLQMLRAACDAAMEGLRWVRGHWGLALLVLVVVPIALAVILALVWVTSRFKFIYLDNLVRRRAEVAEPWRRLRRLGDSLFLFRLAFGLLALLIGGGLVALLVISGVFSLGSGVRPGAIVAIVIEALLLVAFAVVAIYAALFLESFVVPIMYRRDLTALPAWRVFLPWLSAADGSFLVYGLFVLLLFVMAAAGLVVVGLATCCIGFLLVALPYVGTVVLLPLLVAYRYLSLEFLAQIDPTLNVFLPTEPMVHEAPEGAR